MQVGSGILLGAFGRATWNIDKLGFLILRKINKVDMTSVKYDMRGNSLFPPRLISALDVTMANPPKESYVIKAIKR